MRLISSTLQQEAVSTVVVLDAARGAFDLVQRADVADAGGLASIVGCGGAQQTILTTT